MFSDPITAWSEASKACECHEPLNKAQLVRVLGSYPKSFQKLYKVKGDVGHVYQACSEVADEMLADKNHPYWPVVNVMSKSLPPPYYV